MNLLGSRDEPASMLGVPKEEIIRRLSGDAPEGEVRLVSESPTLEVIEDQVDLTNELDDGQEAALFQEALHLRYSAASWL